MGKEKSRNIPKHLASMWQAGAWAVARAQAGTVLGVSRERYPH